MAREFRVYDDTTWRSAAGTTGVRIYWDGAWRTATNVFIYDGGYWRLAYNRFTEQTNEEWFVLTGTGNPTDRDTNATNGVLEVSGLIRTQLEFLPGPNEVVSGSLRITGTTDNTGTAIVNILLNQSTNPLSAGTGIGNTLINVTMDGIARTVNWQITPTQVPTQPCFVDINVEVQDNQVGNGLEPLDPEFVPPGNTSLLCRVYETTADVDNYPISY